MIENNFFFHNDKKDFLLYHYIVCSCYETHIKYNIKNSNKICACHCNKCIEDNTINTYNNILNNDIPVIWVNAKNYNINNGNITWKKTGIFSKRGYCSKCNNILIIDYYFRKYVHDINIAPKIDIFCYNKNKQITQKCFNSWFKILLYDIKISE
jgi:hypothetical protein